MSDDQMLVVSQSITITTKEKYKKIIMNLYSDAYTNKMKACKMRLPNPYQETFSAWNSQKQKVYIYVYMLMTKKKKNGQVKYTVV